MNYADAVTQKKINELEQKIHSVYAEAEKDIKAKMKDANERYKVKKAKYVAMYNKGEITSMQLHDWYEGQKFMMDQLRAKKDQIASVMTNANKVAMSMINNESIGMFAFGANYEAYSLEHTGGVNFGFGLYDSATVSRLVRDDPSMLPKWKVNEKKDYKWNRKKVENAVTQGTIQGEDLETITDRIADALSTQNDNRMKTFARTAMTGAQNAGRVSRLEEAKGLGINVLKQWMATLDGRTRDSHRAMDGEKQKVGDKWHPMKFSNGCRYPGDPEGPPREVYNCRCTMVGDLEDFPEEYERYDNIDGKPIKNMTYQEWEDSKQAVTKYEQAQIKVAELQQKIADVGADKVFSYIWYNQDVTYADWEAKKGSIQSKMDYYDQQIAKYEAEGNSAMKLKMKSKKAELEEFSQHGEEYSKLLEELKQAQAEAKKYAPAPVSGFGPWAYTQERKDNAVWAKTQEEADKHLRGVCGEVWRNSSYDEKESIYEYTGSYHKYNEPLRGYEYGTSRYVGVGNTDLNASYADNGERLNHMTDIINKSSYSEDIWLQRGCDYGGMDKFFACDPSLLRNGTQEELERELLGKVVTEYGFMSCGSSKGSGFDSNPIILNVYCPSGTKMMYVEPFSRYGGSFEYMGWDGVSTQSRFGTELETILQQGTQFRVMKVERSSYGTIYFDIDVINQDHQQRWVP